MQLMPGLPIVRGLRGGASGKNVIAAQVLQSSGVQRGLGSPLPWVVGQQLHRTFRCPRTAMVDNAAMETMAAVQLTHQPGDLLSYLGPEVNVVVEQPRYAFRVLYRARGRCLQGATRLWAHMGHSSWCDTMDVELYRQESDPEVWVGTYTVPTGRLNTPWHAEVQLVFKGLVDGFERFDNNAGRNWSMAVELVAEQGLVAALNPSFLETRSLVSSLLLRIERLCADGKLTEEQSAYLRTLAWQRDLRLLTTYQQVQHEDERRIAGSLAARCSWLRPPGLYVVHIASEMTPIAKVGGLADVVTALAKAHQASGTLVEVIIPKYDIILYDNVLELKQLMTIAVPWGGPGVTVKTVVWCGLAEGLPVYFIEPQHNERYFWREKFYGAHDDEARFTFFSRAALEFLARRSHKAPDIIHAHDWAAAAVVPLLKETYRSSGLSRTKAVFTIHNLAYQGIISADYLTHMGVSTRYQHFVSPDVMLHGHDGAKKPLLSLLKGGIVYADRVTTVSPTYSREVLTPEFGEGLQGLLQHHQAKFMGLLNGIDHETWDPARDPCIPAHYHAYDLGGKEQCKQALLQELNLPYTPPTGTNGSTVPGRPLLAVISRLAHQKGLHLILAGAKAAMAMGAQVVVLGTTTNSKDEAEWRALKDEWERGSDGRIRLEHNEKLSHRLYAACDMLLVPSKYEPCGLTQLIALRYGSIPIVRTTGGLVDTVRDVAHYHGPEHERNGFTFDGLEAKDVEQAVKRAVDAYRDGHHWWKTTLLPRVMAQDWSWSKSAEHYMDLYHQLM